MSAEERVFATLGPLLDRAGTPYALIGGHAVNVWLEPRFTADIDLTVSADFQGLSALRNVLESAGFEAAATVGVKQSSGPDFVSWVSPGGMMLEVQLAKTDFQRSAIHRAETTPTGLRVATREDLIVLKLIANRAKDHGDLVGLCALPDLDWDYVELWASRWGLVDLLRNYRNLPRL